MELDYRLKIISELDILRKNELQNGNRFKSIAYSKVINQLKEISKVEKIEDLSEVKGIGKSILNKITEILKTDIKAPKEQKKNAVIEAIDIFTNIYGVGVVKATKLVKEDGIITLDKLRKESKKDDSLLNKNQKKGLLYYDDFLERIPRIEMKEHSRIIKTIIKEAYPDIQVKIVGSYRRGELTSGDIDVLIKWTADKPIEEGKTFLTTVVNKLISMNYIKDTLAMGNKKFMGVSQVDKTFRRLDMLITPEEEYAFALMYFTGSAKFNIGVRKIALEKGYSLNEHGLTPKKNIADPPILKSEADIFNFLGIKMVEPRKRADENILLHMML